jgi:glucose-6-phosphate 1-dehydrogenase
MTINIMTGDRAQGAAASANRVKEPCTLVLFGASGDLTQRMVMPAIFRLARRGLLSPEFHLIGYARSEMTDDEFRARMRKAVMREAGAGDEQAWTEFAANLSYLSAEYDGDDLQGYAELARRFEMLDGGTGAGVRRLFYLATPPALFAPIMKHLGDAKLAGQAHQPAAGGWARFIIEKPFGHDLASARALNADILHGFDENDIYRIDHFLGKEIVQNLFALRFANGIFEPVWNRNYIDHVQITAAETLGMEERGSYYETAGAIRDMVQNHLLQLCALVAIEPPAEWNPRAVRDEKVKALRAVRKIDVGAVDRDAVRGQYGKGDIAGEPVSAYREEKNVAVDSPVETYAALRLHIDNVRWAGVPFYLRSGKRLAKRATEIVVEFKPAPHTPWIPGGTVGTAARPNLLVVNVSPEEGIVIRVEAKQPGQEMRLHSINLDYCRYDERGATESPSAYEHLLLDSLRGDPTFFTRADEVEAAWEIVGPVIEKWEAEKSTDFPNYAAGSSGPAAADELLARDGRYWYDTTDQAGCKINVKDADSSRAKGAEG